MHRYFLLIATVLFLTTNCPAHGAISHNGTKDSVIYASPLLRIRKVADHVFMHTSFLQTADFGQVPCNGMIVSDGNEAVVFDTPANEESTGELLDFLKRNKIRVTAVIATHFHADCLAGLKEVHKRRIPSFAENRTIKILRTMDPVFDLPETGFTGSAVFRVGNKQVYAGYFGQGHTGDNIIGYFADQHVLFGGCLIKEIGAGKGNLEDANVAAWPGTVQKVRLKFPDINMVIPGHGKPGGTELLNYTIGLFKE
ncbi:MAG TPA: subclass B1 metallo-beta-lactamase [Sphingobacteriaceae bacterium]